MKSAVFTSVLRGLQAAAGLAALMALAGCSSQQAYGAGQAWQRNECHKLADAAERNRCLGSANTSYEEFKRQSAK